MKQLIKRIIKKGIGWHVDPLYRENEELKKDIQVLYKMLDEISESTSNSQNVHGGGGTFAQNIVPPDGIRVWIYRAGDAGSLASRYIKEYTRAVLAGMIDDLGAPTAYQAVQVMPLAEAIGKIEKNDWVLFCGDGCANSLTYQRLSYRLRACGVTARVLHFWDLDLRPMFRQLLPEGYEDRFISRVCTYQDFLNPLFSEVYYKLCGKTMSHRKNWEWVYIVRALESFNCLRLGAKGLGFAVGAEPLPSYFASKGVKVLATDLDPEEAAAQAWIEGNQHVGKNVEKLLDERLCTRAQFKENVSYRYVNMNAIPGDLQGFDFCWSSCAIEHVGSLEQSKQFLKNMLTCLKPGGIAVHTTEFNLTSDVDTVESGNSIIFRKKDIEEMKQYFLSLGCEIETSYLRSNAEADNQLDIPPFFSPGAPPHINLVIDGYASTSFAIIVRKPY